MKSSGIKISGYVYKDGKLVKREAYASVSDRLKKRASKKIRVGKRGI